MIIENVCPAPIIVVGFCNRKMGPEHLVMAGETESQINGPLLATTLDGPVYFPIAAKFTISHQGRHDPENGVLLLADRQAVSHVWHDEAGVMYGVRAWHFLAR